MFEISGDDITNLSDRDLRSLVAQLARAELRSKGHPLSSVTAGGHQDAPDGGIDVRVECPLEITNPDFVPRRLTGFQVKKPDMPLSAIIEEMCPNGVLRDAIRDLADASGAYVIVSAQGSVTDKPLADRRQAMRDALGSLSSAAQLHTNFYDRERLANWVNEYPGVAAWVRCNVGRPLSGWSGIWDWEGSVRAAPTPYLYNDKASLTDERSHERKHLTIEQGIKILRAGLRTPKQCIRLIGLSGLGKTRLVQALFEEGVGEDPLDSSIAVYTDYSEETDPTARNMARELIVNSQRAILVVDNCNPDTHSELARICSSESSQVSLITIEYDVRGDELERTDVFRLESISPELLTEWIKQSFPHISHVDRDKIAEFSDGNFRIARSLAETLGKGETLGTLKNRDLFERIFRQRNDSDKELLKAAEDLSLLYSVDGEDATVESELARVGAIRGIGALPLYEALVEMRRRGVVQARGRFRAILPQAISNRLAALALDRIPPTDFDQFCTRLTPRMLKSVARRLGYLHDSLTAQATVTRWLRADGPLGDLFAKDDEGFQIITNIAPVVPESVLATLEQKLNASNSSPLLEFRSRQWIHLIKAIGYDANLFDRAVTLLLRSVESEKTGNDLGSGYSAFAELFYLYLSGTQATPEQRRAAIKRLASSDDENSNRCAQIALTSLLKTQTFMSMGRSDFGARSRDWGWEPKTGEDIKNWYEEAIKLVVEIAPEAEARKLVAGELRQLWHGCSDAIERAAEVFIRTRPWIEGWIAGRAALRFDGEKMPEDVRGKLEQFIERLKPTDLLNQARAIVLNRMPGGGGWDLADGEDDEGEPIRAEEKADRLAQDIGRTLAHDDAIRAQFLAELLVAPQALRAHWCGRGLASGTDDLHTLWNEIVTAYNAAEAQTRDPRVLGGFIYEAHQRDQSITSHALDAVISDSDLLPLLPYLQLWAGIDEEGIARLRRGIFKGELAAASFHIIAGRAVSASPPEPLAALLEDIARLSGGVEIALKILHMRFFCNSKEDNEQDTRMILLGRDLICRADFARNSGLEDYETHTVIKICLIGEDGQYAAKKVCENIRKTYEPYRNFSYDLNYTMNALFEVQPFVALDTFLLPSKTKGDSNEFDMDVGTGPPIENLDLEILQKWASVDPDSRYPLIGNSLKMFTKISNESETLSPLFVSLLKEAPDKRLFLGDYSDRLHSQGGSGSLRDAFIQRKELVMKLTDLGDEQVGAWVAGIIPEFDSWIEHERGRDRMAEESFE